MDYDLLETFVLLCENRNLTKTAELLYKTQPTITSRIKTLEEKLGYSLIVRGKGKKNVEITRKGGEFLIIAQKFLNLYEEIEVVQEKLSKTLLVSSISSLGSPIVANVCKKMAEDEEVNISIFTYQTIEAYELIAKKELDVAFVSEARNVNGVMCEPVFMQDYYVIRPCKNPEGIKKICTEDLDVNYEIYQRWSDDFKMWHDYKFASKKPRIEVDSCALLKQFLTNETYWSIIQRSNLLLLNQEMSLQIYNLIDSPPARICYMLTNYYPDRGNIYLLKKMKKLLHQYAFDNDLQLTPN
ncbi:DNA-binding transcriptional LysR family regulator [Lachnotalea glycerini]|uniref:DNA-binding transcriptional LysR family regulator n=1 Tax=Lachnotalea glycerini TaxID=1763509 RepID=A0A255I7Z7_9FIRM|nr:LysR family transcriptional regulator [Lachnotalea glycerini]PXV91193.1 DNA-binding transcriptional LysR family regulator [Lachnotalea glycerini]RDY31646.1 LysR family transcriptional regulator [Lachnotalea glycerini]